MDISPKVSQFCKFSKFEGQSIKGKANTFRLVALVDTWQTKKVGLEGGEGNFWGFMERAEEKKI